VERAFAGAYGGAGPVALTAAVKSAGPVSTARAAPLSVAWTGPPAPLPPRVGSLACLLDGEIHNHEQVAELARVSPMMPPESVLAAAYARVGEQLLTRLRGEFALLIWDARARTGILARDQLGSGSCFVHAAGGRLLFASELTVLLDALPSTPGPHGEALSQWLAEGTVPAERTLYEGVMPVPPASLLRLGDGKWESERYWSPRYVEPLPIDRDQAAAVVRRGVFDAVGRRLAGGGTAGVLVSGGVDSGAVLAAADRAADRTVALRAYSAVFPRHRSMDESDLIRVQVEHLGLPDTRHAITGGRPLDAALRYLDRWRVPLPVPGHFIWEPLLTAAAAHGADCLLDGELGDELFGAGVLLIADRVRRGRLRDALRLARELPGAGSSPSGRWLVSILARYGVAPSLPDGVRRIRGARAAAPWWMARNQARRHRSDPEWWRSLDGPMWWAGLADAVTRGPDRLGFFDYFRRRGRAAGVPAHHPFLDLDLIETVLRLPPEHAFDPRLSRPLLRHAMRGLVPEPVRMRGRKSYFDPLLIDCLAVNDRERLRRLLTARDAEVWSFADSAAIRSLVDGGPRGHPGGERPWLRDMWRLATAECWLRSQADRGFARRLLDRSAAPRTEGREHAPRGRGRAAKSSVSPT
jgi:asparagine synthase (glutamine-hydrolysing)